MPNNHMGLLSAAPGGEQARFIHLVGLEPRTLFILSRSPNVCQH